MATLSSVLVWEIPGTEEPGGYSPWGRKESDTTEQGWLAGWLADWLVGWMVGWRVMSHLTYYIYKNTLRHHTQKYTHNNLKTYMI